MAWSDAKATTWTDDDDNNNDDNSVMDYKWDPTAVGERQAPLKTTDFPVVEAILEKQTRRMRLNDVTIWHTLTRSPNKLVHVRNPADKH